MPSLAPAATAPESTSATGSAATHAGCAALAAEACAPPAHPTRRAAEGVIPGSRTTRRLAIANTVAAHSDVGSSSRRPRRGCRGLWRFRPGNRTGCPLSSGAPQPAGGSRVSPRRTSVLLCCFPVPIRSPPRCSGLCRHWLLPLPGRFPALSTCVLLWWLTWLLL
jgi:hypothetical protein